MHILAGLVKRLPRKRHPVLPADQSAHAARGRFAAVNAVGVAGAPDHALGVRRHQLAMMRQQRAVAAVQKQ